MASCAGKDEWERVSWDEALDLVAQGLTRAKEQYGNRSILLLKGWNPEMTRTMGAFGGFTNFWDTNSYGSWSKTPFVIGFHHDNMQDQTINDRYDLAQLRDHRHDGYEPGLERCGQPNVELLAGQGRRREVHRR